MWQSVVLHGTNSNISSTWRTGEKYNRSSNFYIICQVLVASNKKAEKKIPPAPGLLLYRPHEKKLFVQGEKDWKEIAMEKEVYKFTCRIKASFRADKGPSVERSKLILAVFSEIFYGLVYTSNKDIIYIMTRNRVNITR